MPNHKITMAKHLQRELEKLKKKILSVGSMVEERVQRAIRAIELQDAELAGEIIRSDFEIDEAEVEVEEECLKLLALYQPVAVDLRFITATMKINNDLERVGDEAVNIAERVMVLSEKKRVRVPFSYHDMAKKTDFMMRKSLDSFVNLDLDLAFQVIIMDDAVDEMNHRIYDMVKDAIRQHPDSVGYLLNLLLIARHLERIADHTTNIAEEVIYLIEGEIVRHGMSDVLK